MFWIVILIIILSYLVILLIARIVLKLINLYRNNLYAEKLSREELNRERVRIFEMKSINRLKTDGTTQFKPKQSSGSLIENLDLTNTHKTKTVADCSRDLTDAQNQSSRITKLKSKKASTILKTDTDRQHKPKSGGSHITGTEYCEVIDQVYKEK